MAGVILLPDDWNASYYSLSSTNTADAAFTTNKISSDDWTSSFEAHGAVFLPAAGYRYGSSVINVSSHGFYWSATASGSDNAYRVFFRKENLIPANAGSRYWGLSVRLVRPVE